MASVQTRPADVVTEQFLLLGMPVVEFSLDLSGGGQGAFFSLGIVDSAEIQKELQNAQLRSAQSGTSKLISELVRQFDATLRVGLFRHNDNNMQLMFASTSITQVSGGAIAVTDDRFLLTSDPFTFLNLSQVNLDVTVGPVLTPGQITAEAVGTGDGTTGDTSGDFSLDFKPLVIGDVSGGTITVAGVDFTPVATGAASVGDEVEVEVGTGALAGDLQFFDGGGAVNVTGEILATYKPTSAALVENTDFFMDFNNGTIRVLGPFDGATDRFRTNQPMELDYTYTRISHADVVPYTQFVFTGRARIRQITDVGANLVWTVTKAQIQLTDDAFSFNRDEFTISTLDILLLEDTSVPAAPYGTLEIYQDQTTL